MDEDFLDSMYGDDEEEMKKVAPLEDKKIDPRGATVRFKLDGIEVEVPSVAYVQQLERLVQEQDRTIKKLQTQIKQVRHFANSQSSKLNDVARHMDNKIDRRDLP